MRVLGRLRLSRSTEESTSIERQREIIQAWAESNNHTLAGWAEDIDVSGSVDPFETPGLGPFLSERAPEWDILASWKLDRLGRNAIQLNKLFGWCLEHGKTAVSVSEGIDITTPVGRLIANVIGFLAEGELEAIRERVRGSKRKLRELGRWGGGKPPYGYKAVKRPDAGYSLVVDPESARVVRRIVMDLIEGKSITTVANELNSEGVLPPKAYYDRQRGSQGPLRGKWHVSPIRNMLRSKAIRGFAHHQGETVRDSAGMPIQLAEPLVNLDEWELIQSLLDTTQQSRAGNRTGDSALLSGIGVCIRCEAPLHHDRTTSRGHVYRYYRCKNKDLTMIPAETLETLAEEGFKHELGESPVKERIWVPGDARESDLREAVTALEELSKAAGRAKSMTAKQRLQAQLDSLDERIAELESAPALEARWEYQKTGGTYGEVWDSYNPEQRRELLRKSGIVVAAGIYGVEGNRSKSNAGSLHFEIRVPEQLREKLA